ncbi:hypothetical protein [Jeotgalibacillus proteolyticus]
MVKNEKTYVFSQDESVKKEMSNRQIAIEILAPVGNPEALV